MRSKALKWGESSEVLLRKGRFEKADIVLGFRKNEATEAATARGANPKRAEPFERVDGFASGIGPEG